MGFILSRLGRLLVGIVLVVAVTFIALNGSSTPSTVAAKAENSVGKPSGTSGSSSLSLVLLNSTDGLPHWGQNVTFTISTSATTEPYVSLDCYQNGALVYGAMAGFFPSYPWPGSQIFPLASPSWSGGAASCTAKLYYFNGRKNITLTSLNIPVHA
jgi:hypothetical protein